MTAQSPDAARPMLAILAFCAGAAAAIALWSQGVGQWALGAALAVCWGAALAGVRPFVVPSKQTGLYFAFGVLALLVFFLHETHEFEGKVRTFPLIVGYAGLVLSVLDIISLTDTALGRVVTRFGGAALDETQLAFRPVRRELLTFAGMGGAVLGIYLLGFLIAAPLFVGGWMWLAGRKKLRDALYAGFFTLLFIYVLFELILSYELFRGVLILPLLE